MATKLTQDGAGDARLVEARIRELELQLENERAELAALQAPPSEPQGDGAVIRFAKYGKGFCFAAIKVTDLLGCSRWYVTQDGSRSSRQGHPPKTWDALLEWIGGRNWDGIEVLS